MPSDRSPSPASADDAEIARGEVIGRHVIVGVVGRGATGTVYKAFDTHLNRTLAIKILHREHAWREGGDPIELRMRREAQAMARLTHPNVVTVHDVGVFDQRIFIAMEFVDGGTLKTWLAAKHSARERLAVVVAAGRGLAAAHAAGLIHRDFKPDNVLVGNDGRVLVTDFGLARMADDEAEDRSTDEMPPSAGDPGSTPTLAATQIRRDAPALPLPPPPRPSLRATAPVETFSHPPSMTTPLTLTGSILGTLGYMAPEQVFGETTNAASDQFSFCATLYVALYGRRPFPGSDVESYVAAIERPLPPPPADSDVPAWIHKIVARGLSNRPDERFPSMDALLGALTWDPKRKGRRRRTLTLGALALAAVAGATSFAVHRRATECAADPTDLEGVWDDPARNEVKAAFERSGATGAADVAGRVIGVLNETTAKWTAMKTESCEATLIRKRQPEEAYALRSQCLDRRRSELRSLVTSFRIADKAVVERAVAAAYGLTNVGFCADVAMLEKSGGLPDAPEAREDVLQARTSLAAAYSLELVGKVSDSTREAERALGLARASRHASTVAEALYTLGSLEVEQNEYAQAEKLLGEGTWTAAKAGADALVVRMASMTAFVVGSKLGHPGEARVWLGAAEAALSRVGASRELELEFEEHRAWVMAEGDGEGVETIPAQERIVQAYDQLYGVHPRTLRALYNLGDALTSVGDHERACGIYARAVTMGEAVGGPIYSWTGYALGGRGDCLVAQGDYEDGDKALDRAIRIFEATSDEYSEVETLEVVIRSALAQGQIERSVAAARMAQKLLEGVEGTASLVAIVNVPIAEALMREPPSPEAEGLCRDAEREQELLSQVDPKKTLRADALRCLGEALLLEGRARDALPYLERSLAIPHRTYPGDLARARLAMARAIRLTGGDSARASTLERDAIRELEAAPGLKYELEAARRSTAPRP